MAKQEAEFTGFETFGVTLTGTSPLMMHNGRMADATNPLAMALRAAVEESKAIKKRKGDDTGAQLHVKHCEFMGALYIDAALGPFVESRAVETCMQQGAKLSREGRTVERGITIMPVRIPVQYDGPREAEALWSAGYHDTRIVSLDPSKGTRSPKGPRCRPSFPEWSLSFTVMFSGHLVDPARVVVYLRDAGLYEGLLEGRSKLKAGRFEVSKVTGDARAVASWEKACRPYLTKP